MTTANQPPTLRFNPECYGAHHQQIDMLLWAYGEGGRPIGYIDYSVFDGEVHINYLEVPEALRRRGIAAALYGALKREEAGRPINWGLMTSDGYALYQALEGADEEPLQSL